MNYRMVSDGNRALAAVALFLGVAAITLCAVVMVDPAGDILGMSGTLITASVTQPYQAAVVAGIFGFLCLVEAVLARLDLRGTVVLGLILATIIVGGIIFQSTRVGFGYPGQILPLVLGTAMFSMCIMVGVHRRRIARRGTEDTAPIQPLANMSRSARNATTSSFGPHSPGHPSAQSPSSPTLREASKPSTGPLIRR